MIKVKDENFLKYKIFYEKGKEDFSRGMEGCEVATKKIFDEHGVMLIFTTTSFEQELYEIAKKEFDHDYENGFKNGFNYKLFRLGQEYAYEKNITEAFSKITRYDLQKRLIPKAFIGGFDEPGKEEPEEITIILQEYKNLLD